MNKAFYILTTIAAITFASCEQKNTALEDAVKLYELSLENQDMSTAKLALSQILLHDTTNYSYKDSLSRIFIKSGNFDAGLRYAEEVYNSGNSNSKLRENMALAYQQIGEIEKSEKFIDNLLVETGDNKYLFQKLVIQYESGNQMMLDSISTYILDLVSSDSLVAQTMVPMPSPVSGGNQLVPIEAATYFLVGNNALERKQDVRTAVNYLQKSIEKFDEFEMPRYVLMEIQKMMGGGR